MRLHLRFPVTLVALLALGIAACGGRQRPSATNDVWWTDIGQLVPADVTWAFVGDPDAVDIEELRRNWSLATLGEGSEMTEILRDLEANTGVDFRSPAALDQVGLDAAGQFAIFSTALAPMMVFSLADRAAFEAVVERVLDANPDATATDAEFGGLAFRTIVVEELALDVGTFDRWAVVRFRLADDATSGVPDAEFSALLSAPPSAALLASPEATATQAYLPAGLAMSSFGVIRSAALSEAIERALVLLDSEQEQLDAMGLDSLSTGYRSDEERARCEAAAERFTTSIPWIAMAAARDQADQGTAHAVSVIRVSPAAAERATDAVTPLSPAIVDDGANAAIYFAGGLDVAALLGQMNGDRTLTRCPSAAAIPGAMGRLREQIGREAIDVPRYVDGRFAFALYGMRFAGFLPFIDAIAAAGSPNPALLSEPLQQQIESNGGQGRTDPTSAITTIDYDLMHLDIRLLLSERDIAIGVGEVPQRTLNALAAPTDGAAGDPFLVARLSGARVAGILEGVLGWAESNGTATEEIRKAIEPMITAYRRIESITGTAWLQGSDVVFRQTVRTLR